MNNAANVLGGVASRQPASGVLKDIIARREAELKMFRDLLPMVEGLSANSPVEIAMWELLLRSGNRP